LIYDNPFLEKCYPHTFWHTLLTHTNYNHTRHLLFFFLYLVTCRIGWIIIFFFLSLSNLTANLQHSITPSNLLSTIATVFCKVYQNQIQPMKKPAANPISGIHGRSPAWNTNLQTSPSSNFNGRNKNPNVYLFKTHAKKIIIYGAISK
jgi:hypothetical protein